MPQQRTTTTTMRTGSAEGMRHRAAQVGGPRWHPATSTVGPREADPPTFRRCARSCLADDPLVQANTVREVAAATPQTSPDPLGGFAVPPASALGSVATTAPPCGSSRCRADSGASLALAPLASGCHRVPAGSYGKERIDDAGSDHAVRALLFGRLTTDEFVPKTPALVR